MKTLSKNGINFGSNWSSQTIAGGKCKSEPVVIEISAKEGQPEDYLITNSLKSDFCQETIRKMALTIYQNFENSKNRRSAIKTQPLDQDSRKISKILKRHRKGFSIGNYKIIVPEGIGINCIEFSNETCVEFSYSFCCDGTFKY